MVRSDGTITIARVIASPALPQPMGDALRRSASGALLGCVSDPDVNATFLSLRADDLTGSGQLKTVAGLIGADGARGRSLRVEIQPQESASLGDDQLRAVAVELHGVLQAPVFVARRSVPVSAWARIRPMSWGPAGLFAQSQSPTLPFGGSESGGLAIEVGPRTTIAKVGLVGAPLEPNELAAIAAAAGGGESGFVEVAAYPVGGYRDGKSVLVLELGDLARTPLHRVLETIEIEARRFGARLGFGALLSDAPLQLFIGALGVHMGLPLTASQVIETHVPRPAATA